MNENINTKNLNSNFKNREKFKFNIENRLKILQERQINPDNIFDFYDDFLNGLIDISEQVLNRYIKEERVPTKKDREKGIQEDEAFKYFNLDSISEIINKMSGIIHERSSRLEDIKEEIVSRSHIEKRLFVPPDRDDKYIINVGNGGGIEEKRNIPRLLTLIYILENDLDLNLEDHKDITINKGINEENMMRKESYIRVLIPELNRIVYICDEEGNASFVFDRNSIKEKNLSAFELDNYTKINFNELIENNKNIGVKITQSKNWRERMLTALTKDISEFEKKKSQIRSDLETKEDVPLKKEGWESAFSLQKIFGIHQNYIEKFAEDYREFHPEWFEKQRVRGYAVEHYSPELISVFKKYKENNFENFKSELKKKGWLELGYLSKKYNIQYRTLLKFVEKFRKDKPEWFKLPIDSNVELYFPNMEDELVKYLKFKKDSFKNYPNKKEGWVLSSVLSSNLGEFGNTINLIANKLLIENPNWAEEQTYFVTIGSKQVQRTGIFYSPVLVDLVTKSIQDKNKKMESISEIKEGWSNAEDLRKELKNFKVGVRTIKVFAEKFRLNNPEWFELQKKPILIKGKKIYVNSSEHYHPVLVGIIKNNFTKSPLVRDGYENASSLKKVLKTHTETIEKFVENYRNTHPAWFEVQRTKFGKAIEHYSPELVKIIKEHFSKKTN